MSTPFAEAFVEIAVDNARLRQELGESKGIFTSAIQGMVAGAAGALTFGLVNLIGGGLKNLFQSIFADSLSAAVEAEEVDARLAAVVAATGQSAGFTTERLIEMANALEKTTVHGDEAVKSAEAVLLTFKNLKGSQFEGALTAVSDFASFMGTDMASAARAVGRAMEDPETGLRALKQAGVVFNDEQIKVIKNLMDTGEIAKAQQMVLDGLAQRIGGVGEAMANTFGGLLKQVANQAGNLAEVGGRFLMPILRPVHEFAKDFYVAMQGVEPMISGIAENLGGRVKSAMDTLRGFLTPENFQSVFQIIKNTGEGILNLFDRIGSVIAGPVNSAVDQAQAGFGQVLKFLSVLSSDWDFIWKTMATTVDLYLSMAFSRVKTEADVLMSKLRDMASFDPARKDIKQVEKDIRDAGAGEISRLEFKLALHNKATAARYEELKAAQALEQQQVKLNNVTEQAARNLKQDIAAFNALTPMEMLKGAITGNLPLGGDLRREIDVRKAFGGREVMPMPAEIMAGGGGNAGPGAGEQLWGLGRQFYGIGQALIGTVMKFENKAEKEREMSFSSLTGLHSTVQKGLGAHLMTDLTKQIRDNGKEAVGKAEDGNKLLKEIRDKLGDRPAVFA